MSFVLDERLAAGGFVAGKTRGCVLLLKNEALFPWMIVVPEVPQGVEDLHELNAERFAEVMEVLREVSAFVKDHFQAEKLNVACIGNMVRQMHIHVVGRSSGDPAWPGVVWSFGEKRKYAEGEAEGILRAFRERLG